MQKPLPQLTALVLGFIAICIMLIATSDIFPVVMSRTLDKALQEQVSAADLSAAIEDQRQAATLLTRGASFDQKFQKLSERAQKKGTVPVVVRVRAAFQPEGKLLNAAQRLAQRSLIKESQDQLLAGLNYVPSSLKRFKYVPYIAVVVDTAGLEQLQSSADVLEVIDDKSLKLATAESLPLVGATTSWAGGYTGDNKTIAILDSGVDKTHPDLTGKVVSEACYSDTNPTDLYESVCPGRVPSSIAVDSGVPCTDVPSLEGGCDHGTHIAGTAAGRSGVAFKANIISIQVMSLVTDPSECGTASCLRAKTSDTVLALERVYELSMSSNPTYDIAAVNISLVTDAPMEKYTTHCDGVDSSLTNIINQLKSVGIATIVAAGNYGYKDGVSFPACISSAISVGAAGDGSSAGAGTDGVILDSNSADFLNLLAPGAAITAPIPGDKRYATAAGTSQAAAHVSGAMALLREELPIPANNNSTVWFDDELPAGAVPYPDDTAGGGVTEAWNWVSTNPTPHAGTASHQSSIVAPANIRQHFFTDATSTLQIAPGDILYAWVYLDPDPANKPSEIMLQWHSGLGWAHRAYWGENEIPWGVDRTPSRINMGKLPQVGGWVKLAVPARAVGLEGITVSGMAFTQHGGRVTWGQTGKESASVDGLLSLLSSSGEPVIDERIGAGNRSVPRIRIGVAMGISPPDESWMGAYFKDTTNFQGDPVLIRKDEVGFIDHNFQGVSPAPGIGTTNYSIRWSRSLTVTAGDYRFSVTGDDGVKLYIDDFDRPVLDKWSDKPATSYNVDVRLSAGTHRIKLEYYQGGGDAMVRLRWKLFDPICAQTVSEWRWKGEYFNNANLLGEPVAVKDDGIDSLRFNWGAGPPNTACDQAIFPDYFSVRWTRKVDFAQNKYYFTVSGDDWVRLLIDGHLWYAGTGAQAIEVPLAGPHTIVLEFLEGVGDASVSLCWAPPQLSVVTVYPSAYQTPDSGQGGGVSNPSIEGHGSTYTSFFVTDPGTSSHSDIKSARWSAPQAVSGEKVSIRLKFDWSVSGYASANADPIGGNAFSSWGFYIDYSLDGGSQWITHVSKYVSAVSLGNGENQPLSESGSADILLSNGQNITQVQVRDFITADANASRGDANSSSAGVDFTVSISRIRLEVVRLTPVTCVP
jgi:subtilisin